MKKKILDALTEHKELNSVELYPMVTEDCYFNKKKRFYDTMKQLIYNGLVLRVKKGLYRINPITKSESKSSLETYGISGQLIKSKINNNET